MVEKAQTGRGAGEGGEGGLLPEGLIAAEADNAPPAMSPSDVRPWSSLLFMRICIVLTDLLQGSGLVA